MPEPYAPPVQRQPFEKFRPYRITRIVNMSDPDAPAHFVQDILGGEGSWHWTLQKPTVKVHMRASENLTYTIDYSIADATLKDTGPVTISFYVNDHLLDQKRHDAAGQFHFEKAVPPDWVKTEGDTLVAAAIDKVWVSKGDGAHLGFILTRIGLTQ
jgi:hypothetical protein